MVNCQILAPEEPVFTVQPSGSFEKMPYFEGWLNHFDALGRLVATNNAK
jgi:hypothetical protein